MNKVQDIISQYVPLASRPTSRGWHTMKCQLCHDYKKRAGFKFEGEAVSYNCFNCAKTAGFDPIKHRSIPSKMRDVLEAYGVPLSEFNEVLFEAWKNGSPAGSSSEDDSKLHIRFNELLLPDYFVKLDPNSKDIWHQVACGYLEIERGIDPESYPFLILDREAELTRIEKAKWKGYLVIPYYRNNKVIFYQARNLAEDGRVKYQSPSEGKETAIFGYDEIYKYTDEPLYVHEGFFDAHIFGNSVAVFGNKMTDEQIEILNRCNRQKIVIPDRRGNGDVLAKQGLENDWAVSIPDIGGCKDVNDAVKKYGKMYVVKTVMDNVRTGFAAEVAVSTLCEK